MASISANFGSGDAYTVRLTWSETSQDIEANKTTLKCTCTIQSNRAGVSFSGQAKTDTLTVDGKAYTVSHKAYTVYGGSTVTLWSKTLTIAHDSDGTCEKPISAAVQIDTSFSSSGYIGTVTASGTLTCTAIPRASTLTCGTVTLGTDAVLTIRRASAAFTHTVAYTLGDATGTIAQKTGNTSITWSPALELAAEIPSAKTGTATVTVTTYRGATVIGTTTCAVSVRVPKSLRPKVYAGWASVTFENSGTAAAAVQAFVKGCSRAKVTFDPAYISTFQGASIASYQITCAEQTVTQAPYQTAVLQDTSAEIVCTVVDSRGYTASETLSVTLYAYRRPKLSGITLCRADAAGNPDESGTCLYAKAKLTYATLGGSNQCVLKGYYRRLTGSYGSGQTMTSGVGKVLLNGASSAATYLAKITATDSLGNTASYETTIPTAAVAFHLKDGGNGAAFGKYAEQDDMLEIAWSQLKLGGYLLADYIVERGTSGDWDYVCYQSGRREAWYSVLHQNVTFTASGNLYRSGVIALDPPPAAGDSYTFSSICVDGCGISSPVWFGQAMYGSSSYPDQIALRIFSPTSTTQNVRLRVHACY